MLQRLKIMQIQRRVSTPLSVSVSANVCLKISHFSLAPADPQFTSQNVFTSHTCGVESTHAAVFRIKQTIKISVIDMDQLHEPRLGEGFWLVVMLLRHMLRSSDWLYVY